MGMTRREMVITAGLPRHFVLLNDSKRFVLKAFRPPSGMPF